MASCGHRESASGSSPTGEESAASAEGPPSEEARSAPSKGTREEETLPPIQQPPTTEKVVTDGCPNGRSEDPPSEVMEKVDGLLGKRHIVEAIAELEKILPEYPRSSALLCSLGGALMRKDVSVPLPTKGESDASVTSSKKGLKGLGLRSIFRDISYRNPKTCKNEPPGKAWNPKRAIPHLRKGVELMEVGCRLEGYQHFLCTTDLAYAYSRTGDHARAVKTSQSILKRWPRLPFAHYDKACIHCLADDLDSCHDSFAKALALAHDPYNCTGYFKRRGVCGRQGPGAIVYDATCDEDLTKLREDPRYGVIIGNVRDGVRVFPEP